MSPLPEEQVEQLERLIGRFLDREATQAELRELRQATDRAPAARALFEDYVALDREAGDALRWALGRPAISPASQPRVIGRIGRAVAIAAAACLMMLVWLHPQPNRSGGGRDAARASWFEPQTGGPVVDRVEPQPAFVAAPQQRQRDWIIVPAREPGQYLLIQVDRVQPRAGRATY